MEGLRAARGLTIGGGRKRLARTAFGSVLHGGFSARSRNVRKPDLLEISLLTTHVAIGFVGFLSLMTAHSEEAVTIRHGHGGYGYQVAA